MTGNHRKALGLICALDVFLTAIGGAHAQPYELSQHEVMDAASFTSREVSLFGVTLGDPEATVSDRLVHEKIPGVKAEQEAMFILLLDQRKPIGPMAGVRLTDGKVDLIFINSRFAARTRGLFRRVLTSESPDDIRKVLGQEDSGDENVMGAVLRYEKQGVLVNYLGKDVNVEFSRAN